MDQGEWVGGLGFDYIRLLDGFWGKVSGVVVRNSVLRWNWGVVWRGMLWRGMLKGAEWRGGE